MARDLLDRMLALAEMGKTYEALKLARVMIRHEDAMTGQRDITVGTNKPIQGQGRRQQVQST
jgi:flagellar biosynthesis regulator FlbT